MYNKISAIYEKYHKEDNFSGAGLVKLGDEAIFAEAYGYAHRGFRVKNAIDTKFDTASVTKLFTAVSILQLVDKKLLKLNDKITDIVDLEGTRISKDVTIFHLLTHTSGIADDADEEAGESYADLFINKPNYSIRKCIDFLPQFAYKEPNFKPGTNVRYNNCAYVLLGLAIEKLGGESYGEYAAKNIFNACGMNNTGFFAKDECDADIAEGYFAIHDEKESIIGWRKNIYSYPPVGTADGGAFTTVVDLGIFMRALVDGKILSQEMTREIMKPQVEFEQRYHFGKLINGFGFNFKFDNEGRLIRMAKEGVNEGVAAMFAYYPEIDATSVVLANQTCNVWKLNKEIEDELLKNL